MVQSLLIPPHLFFLCLEAADSSNPAECLEGQVFDMSVAVLHLIFQLLFDKKRGMMLHSLDKMFSFFTVIQ